MIPKTGARLATFSVSAWLAGAFLPWPSGLEMSLNHLTSPSFATESRSVATHDVKGALKAASRATGVDFAYLTANASLESSLDPNAKAKTSSAAGLFQFIESTWADMVIRHGDKAGLAKEAEALASGDISSAERRRIMDLRFNPGIAAHMGAEFAAENAQHLEAGLGRPPADVDMYMAHFLGPGGAVKFLQRMDAAPNASAAAAFPAAARANPSVFYDGGRARSFSEIRDGFDAKLDSRQSASFAAAGESRRSAISGAGASMPASPFGMSPALSVTTSRPALQTGGDPWLTTLVNVQLSMNDSLSRVDRDQSSQSDRSDQSDRPANEDAVQSAVG